MGNISNKTQNRPYPLDFLKIKNIFQKLSLLPVDALTSFNVCCQWPLCPMQMQRVHLQAHPVAALSDADAEGPSPGTSRELRAQPERGLLQHCDPVQHGIPDACGKTGI
jgi:hypothetical protein